MSSERRSSPNRGIIRQGDVLLVPISELPTRRLERVVEGLRIVLAEGEATGHAHVVQGRARLVHATTAPSWRGVGRTYLVVEDLSALIHDEHDRIQLTPGTYEVHRQREYAPDTRQSPGFRQVAD